MSSCAAQDLVALRSGGSWLLCGLKHPGRERSPGRTRECATPRRSSRRKTGRTAEKTPCTRRVLFGRVRAPLPDSDVRSLPRHTRATVQYFDFCQGIDRLPCSEYIYLLLSLCGGVSRFIFCIRDSGFGAGAGEGALVRCRASISVKILRRGLAVGMGACEDGVRRRVVVCSARRFVRVGGGSRRVL